MNTDKAYVITFMKSSGVDIRFHFLWINTWEWNGWVIWYSVHFTFYKTYNLFSKVAAPFHMSTGNVWEFHILLIFVNTWYYYFNFRHSESCVVASYYGFNWHFPNDWWCWDLSCAYLPSGYIWWNVFSNLLPMQKIGFLFFC